MDADPFADCLILTGPTGSGKSGLALDLAERLDAEIVCADSMTLYRGMDIGTAKPSPADRARVPHHLLDVLEPWEPASVAWWLARAAECVADIAARGKQALIVGGTALYLDAVVYGLFDGPAADEAIRRRLGEEAERDGVQALHARLAAVDPAAAARIHANNVRRVIRALEVFELTGRPISEWQTQKQSERPPAFADRCLALDLPRATLYERIDARVVAMFDAGLVEEVRTLVASPRGLGPQAGQGLGYKELLPHLAGEITREQAVAEVQTRSRNFAKRQMTWLRHFSACRLIAPELTFALWESRMRRKGVFPFPPGPECARFDDARI
jgi:tRNA dimethylallyltransferase